MINYFCIIFILNFFFQELDGLGIYTGNYIYNYIFW